MRLLSVFVCFAATFSFMGCNKNKNKDKDKDLIQSPDVIHVPVDSNKTGDLKDPELERESYDERTQKRLKKFFEVFDNSNSSQQERRAALDGLEGFDGDKIPVDKYEKYLLKEKSSDLQKKIFELLEKKRMVAKDDEKSKISALYVKLFESDNKDLAKLAFKVITEFATATVNKYYSMKDLDKLVNLAKKTNELERLKQFVRVIAEYMVRDDESEDDLAADKAVMYLDLAMHFPVGSDMQSYMLRSLVDEKIGRVHIQIIEDDELDKKITEFNRFVVDHFAKVDLASVPNESRDLFAGYTLFVAEINRWKWQPLTLSYTVSKIMEKKGLDRFTKDKYISFLQSLRQTIPSHSRKSRRDLQKYIDREIETIRNL